MEKKSLLEEVKNLVLIIEKYKEEASELGNIGISVDKIEGDVKIAAEDIHSLPMNSVGIDPEYIKGVVMLNNDLLILLYIRKIFNKRGLEILNKLLQEVKEEGIDITDKVQLIVSDVEMPGMDGLTFTKKVKQHPEFSKIPVIINTSLSDKATVDKAKMVMVTMMRIIKSLLNQLGYENIDEVEDGVEALNKLSCKTIYCTNSEGKK